MQKKFILPIAFFLLIWIRLFLVSQQPIWASSYAIHDDWHFITQAKWLLEGNWLGPYDQYTLIKGPFYPVWIASMFLLGIPLLFSQHLLYVFACSVFVVAVKPVLKRKIYRLILLGGLLFNPFSYDTKVFTRVYRDGVYISLILLIVSCLIAIFLKRNQTLNLRNPWVIGLGVSVSAAALTREDTISILPSILFIFILFSISKWYIKEGWKSNLSIWSVPLFIFLASIGIASYLNYMKYSIFSVTEISARDFVSAYSALQRVKPEEFIPMVPVTHETRLKIYEVSPKFSELKPFLEGALGKNYLNNKVSGYEFPEGEFTGGWFIWAFRDAVALAGYYDSGGFPVDYYQDLAAEINAACDTSQLNCFNKPVSIVPAWDNNYFFSIGENIGNAIRLMVPFSEFSPYPLDSSTDEGENELLIKDITQEEISNKPSIDQVIISGWAFNNIEKEVSVTIVKNEMDYTKNTKIDFYPSPDVYDYFLSRGSDFPNSKSARFTISTSCVRNCFLVIRNTNEILMTIPLNDLNYPANWSVSDTYAAIDAISLIDKDTLDFRYRYNYLKMRVLNKIGQVYQFASPYATIIAFLMFIPLTVWIKKNYEYWGIASVLFLSIIDRILMLSIISVASFPAIFPLYLSSLYPLLIAFIIIVLIAVIEYFIRADFLQAIRIKYYM